MADPANHITHLQSHDEDLERVRKCFKRLETFMVPDNYFRSVSGLPPAPYLEQQLSQLALKQNSSDHLKYLARLEVNSILRTLEQPGMYVERSAAVKSVAPHNTCQECITRYTQQMDSSICHHRFEGSLSFHTG